MYSTARLAPAEPSTGINIFIVIYPFRICRAGTEPARQAGRSPVLSSSCVQPATCQPQHKKRTPRRNQPVQYMLRFQQCFEKRLTRQHLARDVTQQRAARVDNDREAVDQFQYQLTAPRDQRNAHQQTKYQQEAFPFAAAATPSTLSRLITKSAMMMVFTAPEVSIGLDITLAVLLFRQDQSDAIESSSKAPSSFQIRQRQ